MKEIAIIGGGPAGLMAAESAAAPGIKVTVFDAKPSVGRKFLVAGKSGLNLTNTERWEDFRKHYSGNGLPRFFYDDVLDAFDSSALRQWVRGLGLETFSVRSGKVFPKPMKAAPLLRAWLKRLAGQGVGFQMRHRLAALGDAGQLTFETPGGWVTERFDAIVLALGGAS